MAKQIFISRNLKAEPAKVEYLTRNESGFVWITSKKDALIVVTGSPLAEIVSDFLFWDYDSDYTINSHKSVRKGFTH